MQDKDIRIRLIGSPYCGNDRLDVEAFAERLTFDHNIPAMVVRRETKYGRNYWQVEVPRADLDRALVARAACFAAMEAASC